MEAVLFIHVCTEHFHTCRHEGTELSNHGTESFPESRWEGGDDLLPEQLECYPGTWSVNVRHTPDPATRAVGGSRSRLVLWQDGTVGFLGWGP